MACPTPLPAPVITAVFMFSSFRQIYPLAFLSRSQRAFHHGLGSCAIQETRDTGALVADGFDELPGLIVAEAHQGIASSGIARGSWPGPKFFWHLNRFHAGTTHFAVLQLVPFTGRELEGAFTAVQLHVIQAAPALVPA